MRTADRFNINYDAFAYGQLESKAWIIEELRNMDNPNLGTVYLLCGWYGILPALMFHEEINVDKIRSFDIDETCWMIADQINKEQHKDGWKFKAITENIFDINFEEHTWDGWSNLQCDFITATDSPDTIINTSCEHTGDDWYDNVPKGKFVIVQCNDFLEGEGHVNCCIDFNDFSSRFPMTNDMYHGVRKFEKYNRFMKMGFK